MSFAGFRAFAKSNLSASFERQKGPGGLGAKDITPWTPSFLCVRPDALTLPEIRSQMKFCAS